MTSPLRHVIRKELREMIRDGRVTWASVIVAVLLVVSAVAGWRHASAVTSEHTEAQAATRAQWERQPAKNPHSAAHYGVFAFKPQSRLAMIDSGVDPYVGVAAWLEAHRQNEFQYRPAGDRTALQRFGDFTPALVMQLLMPLVIVMLTFSLVAGEREQGTWTLVLGTGVAPRMALLGKMIAVAVVLMLIVLPAIVVIGLTLGLGPQSQVFEGDVWRTLPLLGVFVAWCAGWMCLALAVSTRARSTRGALLTLLGVWMMTTLVAPRMISDVSGRWYPTPTATEFQAALAADLADPEPSKRRLDARRAELLAQYNVSTVDALPINFSGVSLQEGEEHGNEVFDRHFGRLFDRFEAQNRFAQRWSFLAPAVALRSVSMALAGTDFGQHRDFVTAAEHYRRDMQRRLNGDVALHQKPGTTYLAGASLWASIPNFSYQAPGVDLVMQQQALGLLALLTWVAGAGGAMVWVATKVRA